MVDKVKLGTKLKYRTQDGLFEGVVFASDARFITFRNAINIKTGQKQPKLTNITIQEIERYEIQVERKVRHQSRTSCSKPSSKLLMSDLHSGRNHLSRMPTVDLEKLSLSQTLGTVDKDSGISTDDSGIKTGTEDHSDSGMTSDSDLPPLPAVREVVQQGGGCHRTASNDAVYIDRNLKGKAAADLAAATAMPGNRNIASHIVEKGVANNIGMSTTESHQNGKIGNKASSVPISSTDVDDHQLADIVLIDKVGSDFHKALNEIMSQKVIGLAYLGVSIGRDGLLCFLQMATPDHTYVYDVLRLERKAFDAGLRKLLESRDVQKVVHNCRSLSDLLFHQYDVVLEHVFDCQVADIMLARSRNHGVLPRFIGNSVAVCIVNNLHVSSDNVFFQRVRLHNPEEDESVWRQRPVTQSMLDAACMNIVYLCRLRCVLMEKMLAGFVHGTNLFLDLERRRSRDPQQPSANSHLLPREFIRGMNYFSRYVGGGQSEGFYENCDISTRDPFIILSHDGISHGRDLVYEAKLTATKSHQFQLRSALRSDNLLQASIIQPQKSA